ncbi:hypothetical protein HOP50_03g21240 [Chloropicon primus]|uniref:Uncharacterized protein n=1 Tax=Chloropicon primus TaxID=1764295 RepID=A0A5B8MGM0_9CHLO|nr:hypothetical protein A3770_03p21240 [Chloropicon primus]UPQ98818.1 hypothetical protein HOP50_03g21240 [Chloropicon primus]|eukprot:QDZ19606.1 hypothetical protein A3770_03p21240 [Chloropicon primus]
MSIMSTTEGSLSSPLVVESSTGDAFETAYEGETERESLASMVHLQSGPVDAGAETPKLLLKKEVRPEEGGRGRGGEGDREEGAPRNPHYGNKSKYVQMWVEEDSKISLTGRLRDPNSLTPATQSSSRDSVAEAADIVARVQLTCESAITNTRDILTDMQSGTLSKVDAAVSLLEKIESDTKQDIMDRHDYVQRIGSENKYLQNELLEARTALDRIYHCAFRSKDAKELSTQVMVMKIIKRLRGLESSKKSLGEEAKKVLAEKQAFQAKAEDFQTELRGMKSAELKLRNVVTTQKSKSDSYKRTIKELDQAKDQLQSRVQGLEAKQKALASEKAAMSEEIKGLREAGKENHAKLEQMQTILRAAQRKKSMTENALEKAEEEIQVLSSKVVDQAAHASEIAEAKEEAERESEALRQHFAAAVQSKERVSQELEQAANESSAKCYRVQELRASLADLNTKYEARGQEFERLEQENQRLEGELAESKSQARELGSKVDELTRKGEAFASLLPVHIETMNSNVGLLYTDLEQRLEKKEKELSKLCSLFSSAIRQHKEKVASMDAFHASVECQLAECISHFEQSESATLLASDDASRSGKIIGYLEALNKSAGDHFQKFKDLKDASECLEVNMVQAQGEVEALKGLVKESERTREQSEARASTLAAQRDALEDKLSSFHAAVEIIKGAVHKRSCESFELSQDEGGVKGMCDAELLIALKLLLEDFKKIGWDKDCIQQDLDIKEECIARLQYKVASFSSALDKNTKKMESYSQLSESLSKDFQTKQKVLIDFNEQLHSKLERKEALLVELKDRLDAVTHVTREQAEKLEEAGQSADVQLYKISSSFRCLDDVESNILESFESLKESLDAKEMQLDSLTEDVKSQSSICCDLERDYVSLRDSLERARCEGEAWKTKYQSMKKMVRAYLPKLRLKLKESKFTKLRASALRKRNVRLSQQVRSLKGLKVRSLQQVREKIVKNVKSGLMAKQASKSSALAGRLWRLTFASTKKIDEMESLLNSALKEKSETLGRLGLVEEENSLLKTSIGKQSEMLSHLHELENFLQRSKETIRGLQVSNEEKEAMVERLSDSNRVIQDEKAKTLEKLRLLEGQLLKTQEELVVTQNQCAVTAKEHMRLIEKYSKLQGASKALQDDARTAQEALELERATYSGQLEQNSSMKDELLAKEHRLRELRSALSSVCSERDKAEATLQQQCSVTGEAPLPSMRRQDCVVAAAATQTTHEQQTSQSVALQTEGESLSTQNDGLEAQAEILLLQTEVGNLKGALRRAEATNFKKRQGLASMQTKVNDLEGEVQAKENSLAQLQGILDNALEALAESTQDMMEISLETTSERQGRESVSTSAHQLKAVEGVIGTWRNACQKRDSEIGHLRAKVEAFASQICELEKESEGKAERRTSLLQLKLKEAHLELKSFAQDLEKHKRKLAKVYSSNQKSLRVINKALSEQKSSAPRDDLEEASKDVSDLLGALAAEVKAAKRKQAKSKSSAQENSEIALALHMESVALKESLKSKEARIKELKAEVSSLEERGASLESKQAAIDSCESRLTEARCDLSQANSKIEKQGRELKELNKMLKAWEAMRICKDSQINALLDKCKLYEDQVSEKSRALGALRQKIAARAIRKAPKTPQAVKPKDAVLCSHDANVAKSEQSLLGKSTTTLANSLEKENSLTSN